MCEFGAYTDIFDNISKQFLIHVIVLFFCIKLLICYVAMWVVNVLAERFEKTENCLNYQELHLGYNYAKALVNPKRALVVSKIALIKKWRGTLDCSLV